MWVVSDVSEKPNTSIFMLGGEYKFFRNVGNHPQNITNQKTEIEIFTYMKPLNIDHLSDRQSRLHGNEFTRTRNFVQNPSWNLPLAGCPNSYPVYSKLSIIIRLRAGRPEERSSIYGWGRDISLIHAIQTDPEAHPASYPMRTRGSFLGNKATGA
jgi:hypothetical protein